MPAADIAAEIVTDVATDAPTPTASTPRDLLVLATMHKPYAHSDSSAWLRPCTVGGFAIDEPGAFSDAAGALHIAALNPQFCELTTQYWAWKNLKDVEHIGFCHYRRYFYLNPRPAKSLTVVFDNSQGAVELMASELARTRALTLLAHADVIVPYPTYMEQSVADHYRAHHLAAHWDVFTEVLFARHPEYACFESYFEDINRCYFCNMAIWKWSHFDRYCTQLFGVLFEVHRRIGVPEDPYQSRYIGFLAERFLGLYLYAQRLRAAEVATVIIA